MISKVLNLKNLIWVCAIGLATFSGYYSIFGISKLFSGGSYSIIGMAAMLELSKLVVVAFLHNYHKMLKRTFKVYLTLSAIILMAITSIGVYGYLTNSYQETAKVVNKAQNEITRLDAKKDLFIKQKQQIDESIKQKYDRISQYDKLRVDQENTYGKLLESKKSSKGLQQNIKSIDQTTTSINSEISTLSQRSSALTDSINKIDEVKLELSNSTFSSEMGPLLYLSNITGKPMDSIVNWFILFLVVVFDPLAVSLIIAANHISINTRKQFSVISGEFLEGKNDHSGVDSENGIESDESEESVSIDDEIETVGLNNHNQVGDDLKNDTPEIKEDLENEKNITIFSNTDLDHKDLIDLDHKDLDQDLIDQDQDLIDQDHNDQDLNNESIEEVTNTEESNFVEQQTFYNENRHRINRASGGI